MIKKISVFILLTLMLASNLTYAQESSFNNISFDNNKESLIFQQKIYRNTSCNQAMKAIINLLQDNYFFIEDADSRIGFILASREFDNKDENIDIKEEFGCGKLLTIIKRFATSRTEINISLTPVNNDTCVRLVLRKKIINMYNVCNKVHDIADPEYYNDFFADLDKELTIKKQN